ncbi:hypothetical protein Rsub_09971 [Raphidocelis subcapitata]|uniref:Queuosine 5'-phosphate N-glycosylase/hydrolase n=1 Tax=Raphidocelis subcapitata TaxID=307507 RepID=A0A2V0PH79_9CHLO|nr:hypothetical protein Rsub_09971 [Raphidocelis subcapitata]|eukprot:GBF97280.1 hypothetical protein Rsub_09971 [Raphidocelis subcapitata]
MPHGHTPLPVLESCDYIVEKAKHVSIDADALQSAARELLHDLPSARRGAADGWDRELHFFDGGPHTLQYLLVLDALNFCFWPDGEFEYEHLAGGLKASLLEDPACLDAERLASIDGAGVRRLLRWGRDLPLQEERARLLREVGSGLAAHFGGRAAALVGAARGSAAALVALVTAHFPGFRDHAVYGGRQVFFYKRAQIFAADVYGAFGGRGLGAFADAAALSCFADYRVPVVLRKLGVIKYAPALAAKVEASEQLPAGGEEECEIRAATVTAVERLRAAAEALEAEARAAAARKQAAKGEGAGEGEGGGGGGEAGEEGGSEGAGAGGAGDGDSGGGEEAEPLLSIHVDWWLWGRGEAARAEDPPHHRTLTIYY